MDGPLDDKVHPDAYCEESNKSEEDGLRTFTG